MESSLSSPALEIQQPLPPPIILITNILGALGSSAWFSWIAALVPPHLRGKYFGIRNSAASLANLVCVLVLGFKAVTGEIAAVN